MMTDLQSISPDRPRTPQFGVPHHPGFAAPGALAVQRAFAKLATHMDIGWDLDGTLIGHPAAPALHRFICSTPRIRHVLITFRTRRRDADPWVDLRGYSGAPPRSLFRNVVFLQDADAGSVATMERNMRSFWRRPSEDALHREWKGRVCRENGLTAMVDDMPNMVGPGCRRYGIELFHPQDFVKP